MQVRPLGQEDALEEEMATHASILAWEIPWTEEPGGLQVPGVTKSRTRLYIWAQTYLGSSSQNWEPAFWLQFLKLIPLQAEEQLYQEPSALP